MTEIIQTNECQTPITDELLSQYPEEVQEQFLDYIATVPFIKNLISPSRPKIEDLPRDDKGRAIIDMTNPPIFKDADYFRQAALYYLENGCYTKLKPNSNPNSEFFKFWKREVLRCFEGLLREEDGMWISGYMYWFLNYCPMLINEYKEGGKKAVRKEAFGYFFEGIWWRFMYINAAIENGHHGAELARRGAHPYFQKVYTPDGIKSWGEIQIGDFLYGTYGNITKVIDIPFDEVSDTYKITLRDGRIVYASDDHMWNVYKKTNREIFHLTTKELISSYRQKRKKSYRQPSGLEHVFFVPKNDGVDFNYVECPIDAYTLGILLGDGCFRNKGYKNQVVFTSEYTDIELYIKNIPYSIYKIGNDNYTYAIKMNINYLYECNLWMCKSEDKFIPNLYKYNSKEIRLHILQGLLDTDGWIHAGIPAFNTVSEKLKDDIMEIARSLGYNCSFSKKKTKYKKGSDYINCLDAYEILIYGGKELFRLQRKKDKVDELRIVSRSIKSCIVDIEYIGKYPCKCVTVDSNDSSYLIGDFVQTHNCGKSYALASMMSKNLILGKSLESKHRVNTTLTAYQKEYLKDDKDGTFSKFVPILSFCAENTPFPRLMLKRSSNEMTWQMGYKDEYGNIKGSLNMVIGVSAKDDSDKLRGKRSDVYVEEFGNFNGLLELYDVTRKSVEEGDYTFALIYMIGTANNKESNFQSAKTLLYAPKAYNIQELDNVYDKKGQGKDKFAFFFPAYINRAGCYNKDGISDVVKAVLQVLTNRYNAKYGADPTSVLRVIAEDPITPAEAIVKVKDAFFPVQALTERAQQLDIDPSAYSDVYVGELYYNSKGEVGYRPTDNTPIRKFPVDNDTKGALEIYMMPEKDRESKVFSNRYILGCLKESELVNTIEGLKKVQDITVDDKLINIDGAAVDIKNLQRYYNTNPVYKVKLSGIYDTTTFSEEHPIYCSTPKYRYNGRKKVASGLPEKYRELNFSFKKVREVRVGDIVKSPVLYTEERTVLEYWKDNSRLDRVVPNPLDNKDFWWLLGLIIGDGYASNNGYSIHICFNAKEHYYINKARRIIKEVFNRRVSISKETISYVELCFSCKYFNTFIAKHIGKGAANKSISEWMKYIKPDLKKELVLGYLASDGCVNNDYTEFVSISKKLLNDIQDILFSLGIISSAALLRNEGIHVIRNMEVPTQKTYHLRVANTDSWIIKSWDSKDLKLSRLTLKKDHTHRRKDIEFTEDRKYILFRVKNIDIEEYKGYVYNFECDTHTFMCNYIPTHNCDPYDNDQAESSSLYSIFVLDLFTDKLVAEYTGRTSFASDAHEIVKKLCLFYNARALYEANKKGLYSYMESQRSAYLLADTPQYLRDKQLVKYTNFGSSAKGVNASASINNFANRLIKDWLLKRVTTTIKNEEGKEEIVEIPQLYLIKSRALLEELIQFNPMMNFDRIRALGMLMLYREEYMIKYGGTPSQNAIEKADASYEGNDRFFSDNYDKRFGSKFSKNALDL